MLRVTSSDQQMAMTTNMVTKELLADQGWPMMQRVLCNVMQAVQRFESMCNCALVVA